MTYILHQQSTTLRLERYAPAAAAATTCGGGGRNSSSSSSSSSGSGSMIDGVTLQILYERNHLLRKISQCVQPFHSVLAICPCQEPRDK